MSLDVTILGKDGRPEEQVCIGLENFGQLMQLIDKDDYLLKRLSDYYTDAEFQNAELDDLVKELLVVHEKGRNNESFLSFVDSFIALAERAKRKQLPIIAIAD